MNRSAGLVGSGPRTRES